MVVEWSSTALRVLRAVAERGSFTAAAAALGYSQSAVSRQVAALERSAGARLFERGPGGVRLTAAGVTLEQYAAAALDAVDRAERLLHHTEPGGGTVRLGVFASAVTALAPGALALMARRRPDVAVLTREASTLALVRSLRAATVDLVVVSSRPPYPPPDDQDPPLDLEVLLEGDMAVAVPETFPLGHDGTTTLAELQAATWIISPLTPGEPGFGAWPTLPRRPTIGHQTRDWMAKLALVAAGCGVATIPPYLAGCLPNGVRLVRVADGEPVTRRALLARRPGPPASAVVDLASCLREVAGELAVT